MIPIAATLGALSWTPCPDLGPLAECTTVQAPDNHDDVEAGLLTMALRRVPAPSGKARGQLWYVPGPPGSSGIAQAQSIDDVHATIAPDLELLTLDVRGVGFSARLDCPEEGEDGLTEAQWAACAKRWAAERVELRRFTTTQTALDLVFAVERARDDRPVYVWASGYGAFLVDRMLSIVDEGIEGVLVDGVMPVDWSGLEADARMDEVGRAVAEACANDPACRVDGSAELAASILERLEAGHCDAVGLDANGARALGAQLLRAGPQWAGNLPALWARLDRCRAADVRALEVFRGQVPVVREESPALARQIWLTDLWDDPSSLQAVEERAATSLVSEGRTLELARADWPFTAPGEFHRFPPPTEVPMLLLHGSLDPDVSPARAEDRAAGFLSGDQHLLAVEGALGQPVRHVSCAQEAARGFLADPSTSPPEACAAEPFPFAADAEQDRLRWGTSTRYVGGCSATGSLVGGWWLVLGWLVRRRRAAAGKATGSRPGWGHRGCETHGQGRG